MLSEWLPQRQVHRSSALRASNYCLCKFEIFHSDAKTRRRIFTTPYSIDEIRFHRPSSVIYRRDWQLANAAIAAARAKNLVRRKVVNQGAIAAVHPVASGGKCPTALHSNVPNKPFDHSPITCITSGTSTLYPQRTGTATFVSACKRRGNPSQPLRISAYTPMDSALIPQTSARCGQ